MPIRVTCPTCAASFVATDKAAGKRATCPKCHGTIQIPAFVPEPARNSSANAAAAAQASAAQSSSQARAAPPTGATSRAVLDRELLNAFRGDIPRVRVSLLYRVGIFLVAVVMLLLPLAYLAIIALTAWGVIYHTLNDTGLLTTETGRGHMMTAVLYAAPIAAGVILIFFMLKPLFARPVDRGRSRSLSRAGEPVLFAFVDRLCAAVGARPPARIEVDSQLNASAGLDRGFNPFNRRLVLTIGAPLVAGLDSGQMAGVLAHEFGHFTQGTGMRLTYVVRTINLWFLRTVYQRDDWDVWLEQTAEEWDFRFGWVLQLARVGVWLSRRILWLLMILGHGVSSFMLRQMEFHADAHEARLVGGDVFESTVRRLSTLGVAYRAATLDLDYFVDRSQLPDDLPRLMMARSTAIPPQIQNALDKQLAEGKTGWFDSHPADCQRIARAHFEGSEPLFAASRPASDLFTDFAALSRNTTWDMYRAYFGSRFKPSMMHPTEQLLCEAQQQASQANQERPPIELD